MKSARLPVLVVVMAVLAAARFLWPPDAHESAVVEPIVRSRVALAAPGAASMREELPPAMSDLADDIPGNAFSVRIPPAPPPLPVAFVPAIRPVPPVTSVTPAPVSVLATPPPFQVIGTYDDGSGPAVFVAADRQTLIARPGTVLLAQYRVTSVTAQSVALVQLSNQQSFNLMIPQGASR